MKKKIAILITDQFEHTLLDNFTDKYEVSYKPSITSQQLEDIIKNYNILVISTRLSITKNILSPAKKLKLIVRLGAGVDHIDLKACIKHKITVCNTPFANVSGVVEYVFGQLLRVYRQFNLLNQQILQGKFREGLGKGRELFGKKIGIIGVGRIGRQIAKTAKVFGMVTYGYDPYIKNKLKKIAKIDKWFKNLFKMLELCDIVTLHVPLTNETFYIVDEQFLSALKDNAILVNSARGKVVNSKSLVQYAKNSNNKFIIDVFENEPFIPSDEIFATKSVFFLSPHAGALTEESLFKRSQEAIKQIKDFISGKKPHGKINLHRGY